LIAPGLFSSVQFDLRMRLFCGRFITTLSDHRGKQPSPAPEARPTRSDTEIAGGGIMTEYDPQRSHDLSGRAVPKAAEPWPTAFCESPALRSTHSTRLTKYSMASVDKGGRQQHRVLAARTAIQSCTLRGRLVTNDTSPPCPARIGLCQWSRSLTA